MSNLMHALYGVPGKPARMIQIERPDFARGDAQYFDLDSAARLQIRPLCISDMAAGYTYRPGCWLLVVLTRSGGRLRVAVPLPARFRKNTAANAHEALTRQLRRDPDFAELIEICDQVAITGV